MKQFALFAGVSYCLAKYIPALQVLGIAPAAILLFFLQSSIYFTYTLYVWPYLLSPLRKLPSVKVNPESSSKSISHNMAY
jgi:hypothetical protein